MSDKSVFTENNVTEIPENQKDNSAVSDMAEAAAEENISSVAENEKINENMNSCKNEYFQDINIKESSSGNVPVNQAAEKIPQNTVYNRPAASGAYGRPASGGVPYGYRPAPKTYGSAASRNAPYGSRPSSGQQVNPAPGVGRPSSGQYVNPAPGVGRPSFGQQVNPAPGVGRPSYGQYVNPAPGTGRPSFGQCANPAPGAGSPSFGQQVNPAPGADRPAAGAYVGYPSGGYAYGRNPAAGNAQPPSYRGGYYGYNGMNPPMYGYGIPYVQRKSFFERVKEYFISKPYKELTAVSAILGAALLAHLFFSNLIGSVLGFSPELLEMYTENKMFSAAFGMIYTIICIGIPFFAVFMILRKNSKVALELPLGRPRKNSHTPLLILAGLGLCYMGNIITSYITAFFSMFGLGFFSTEAMNDMSSMFTPDNAYEFIVMLTYNAVIPAFFEEFAFRGVIMQPLRKYGDWFAILVSSFLFGIIHGNMTQMPFAVIAGIALGYVSVVSGSIWTSVILHFINNALAFLQMMLFSQLSEGALVAFSSIMTYGILFAGIVAIIAYMVTNKNFFRLRKGVYEDATAAHKSNVFFLVPTTFVAVCAMCFTVLADLFLTGIMSNFTA